jgi:hypothetical protein
LAPWADVLYAADFRFWQTYLDEIRACQFTGEMWTVSEQAQKQYGLYWVKYGRTEGFHPDPHTINGGGNSGYQALHLAATFGATKVVLLGYDMQRTWGKEHWHGKHKNGLANATAFASWLQRFEPLARDLKKRGVEVVNATRHTALTCFVQKSLDDALA